MMVINAHSYEAIAGLCCTLAHRRIVPPLSVVDAVLDYKGASPAYSVKLLVLSGPGK